MSRRNPRYGRRHDVLRQQIAPRVEAGGEFCARCGKPILPGQEWDLDHDDHDDKRYIGASHSSCNRGARPSANGHGPKFAEPVAPNPAHAELEAQPWAEQAKREGAGVWSQRW